MFALGFLASLPELLEEGLKGIPGCNQVRRTSGEVLIVNIRVEIVD